MVGNTLNGLGKIHSSMYWPRPSLFRYFFIVLLLLGSTSKVAAEDNCQSTDECICFSAEHEQSPNRRKMQDQSNGELHQISLNAGIVRTHTPFAMADDDAMRDDNNQTIFSGFLIDLLHAIQEFAKEDGIELRVTLYEVPSYNIAFDLVAKDCEAKIDEIKELNTDDYWQDYDCNTIDFAIGDFFSNPTRFNRADLTPSWLENYITANKLNPAVHDTGATKPAYSTLGEVDRGGGTICVPEGTFMSN